MNAISKGGVKVRVPCGVTTLRMCNVTLIELLLEKLNRWKVFLLVSNGCGIPLWSTDLLEMI